MTEIFASVALTMMLEALVEKGVFTAEEAQALKARTNDKMAELSGNAGKVWDSAKAKWVEPKS